MRPTLAVHESENEFRIVKLVPPQFVVCGVKLVEKLGFPNTTYLWDQIYVY